jgi:hypothetical protein
LILLRVAVNHGSTLELRTTLHVDRGAKAAAEAGNNIVGIMSYWFLCDGWSLNRVEMFHRDFSRWEADQAEAKRSGKTI